MKQLCYIAFTLLVFSACSSNDSSDKKTQLEKLKKQETEIHDKVLKMEAELGNSSDSSSRQIIDVAITNVASQNFSHQIDVQAKVDGDENVSVSPETMGTVTRINVKAGDKVSKGTVLAELDNLTYQRGLDELQNSHDFLNTLYTKQKALWDQKIGTEIQYLTAKNNLEAIDRKIATTRQQLDMTKIKSPINGIVDAMDLKIGQAVSPGSQGVRVVNFSKLKVKGEVAEAYISKVKKGDIVEINFPDLNKSISSKLTYAGKVIDPLNRTFNVEVEVNPKEVDLHPNMIAILRIADYRAENSLVLPISVVQTTEDGSYVFIAEGTKEKAVARKRTVVIGKNYNGIIEIKEGLKVGEPVVTTGYQNLVDGQPIKF